MAKSQIIKDLANNAISLEVALNRLLIIASDLENEELASWAENELHGYNEAENLPAYRILQCPHITYSGINGPFQVENVVFPYVPFLKEKDPDICRVEIMESCSVLEGAISASHSIEMDLTRFSGHIYKKTGIACTDITQHIASNHIENLVNCIKTLLLKIFLKLDKEYGCLDELDIDTSQKTAQEVQRVNQIVNNYIDNSIHIGDKNKIDGTDVSSGGYDNEA